MKALIILAAGAAILCGGAASSKYPLQGHYGRTGPHLEANCTALRTGKAAFGWTFKDGSARANDMAVTACTLRSVETVAANEYRLTESCTVANGPPKTYSRYVRGFANGAFTESMVEAPAIASRPAVSRDAFIYAPCGT